MIRCCAPLQPLKSMWLPFQRVKICLCFRLQLKIVFLKLAVTSIGLDSKPYTLNLFRRSGASLAFYYNVDLAKIKQHENWKSDAIWAYLGKTPKAASRSVNQFMGLILVNFLL